MQLASLAICAHFWHKNCPIATVASSRRPDPEDALPKYLLRLFVTGASSRTATAITNLRRICDQELEGQYDLEIIDVQEFPDLAEDEKILATPTLIKSLPLPLRRVIGDLSDTEKVLLGLEVQPVRGPANDAGSAP